MRPFGCPVKFLNIIDHQGNFDGKADEGFFVGYSTNSKAFRVFNSRTRIVEENLQVKFSEDTPNIVGSGPNWLFDIDALTKSMNYETKLIEKCTGNSMDTKFDKPSVVRQPNAQRILKPSVLGKRVPFLDSLKRKKFTKKKSVSITNESKGLSKLVTPQNLPRTVTQAVPSFFGNDQFGSNSWLWSLFKGIVRSTGFTTYVEGKAHQLKHVLLARRVELSHLNFDYINLLSKKDVVIGLPKLKYVKDQLYSSCEVSKAKQSSFKSKTIRSSKGRLNLLHMDLCGLMWVASINGKRYILVIIDDYSRYTWTLFLHSKDETPEVLKLLTMLPQRNIFEVPIISVRNRQSTEFLNKTLNAFFKEEGIEHQTSTPRTPEQNGVIERQKCTLIEAARTMLQLLNFLYSFRLMQLQPHDNSK
ncbi:retrovirus-related pol polyprotein from transposon TNT 1-94 [Tanacetum coccineum]